MAGYFAGGGKGVILPKKMKSCGQIKINNNFNFSTVDYTVQVPVRAYRARFKYRPKEVDTSARSIPSGQKPSNQVFTWIGQKFWRLDILEAGKLKVAVVHSTN